MRLTPPLKSMCLFFYEMDVKQRVLGRAGQVLGAAFKAQGQDLVLGSYTGAELSLPHDRSRKAPDFIATYQKSGSGIVTGVGEARLPAIRPHPPHPLGSALDKLEKGYEGSLRRLLGLVPTYLLETHIKYGFVTSYDETIFLRKVERNGVVGLQYSPVIFHNDRGSMRKSVSLPEFLSRCTVQQRRC